MLPLLGDHQLHNAAVVLAVADTLIEAGWKITEQNIYDGIRDVCWPVRFDIVFRQPLFIIDGGHNPKCIEALVKNIQEYLAGRKVIALTGVLADKDYSDMYRPVIPLVDRFVCITPPNPRKLEAEQLARYLRQTGAQAEACADISAGVEKAMVLAGEDGVTLCFGSLYSIGAIRDSLTDILNRKNQTKQAQSYRFQLKTPNWVLKNFKTGTWQNLGVNLAPRCRVLSHAPVMSRPPVRVRNSPKKSAVFGKGKQWSFSLHFNPNLADFLPNGQ